MTKMLEEYSRGRVLTIRTSRVRNARKKKKSRILNDSLLGQRIQDFVSTQYNATDIVTSQEITTHLRTRHSEYGRKSANLLNREVKAKLDLLYAKSHQQATEFPSFYRKGDLMLAPSKNTIQAPKNDDLPDESKIPHLQHPAHAEEILVNVKSANLLNAMLPIAQVNDALDKPHPKENLPPHEEEAPAFRKLEPVLPPPEHNDEFTPLPRSTKRQKTAETA